ncbi:hypothetical protein BT69DRAFT_478037 [Atractiella rhizophila]|nr:hypothetical protein BT69DRAFT_478037 [Atractiella rhizophila]
MTEMLSVANEFLLDRLKSICGAVLRPIISLNNCISILADADFYHLHSLKQVIMSFLCRNLETAMEMRLLDDADDFLMNDLAVHARQLQFDFSPVSRSRKLPQTCVDAAAREDGLSIPQYGSSSYISPSVFESLPIGTPSPPFNPYSSPDRSPIPAIHEGEEQFLMDMDEEVPTLPSAVMSVGTPSDALPAQLPVTPTGSSAQLLVSADLPMQGNFSTPPTVTTTGQVWRLASQQNRPASLRDIMVETSANTQRTLGHQSPYPQPSSTPPTAVPAVSSQVLTPPRPLRSPGKATSSLNWRAQTASPKVSLVDIQAEQDLPLRLPS